VISNAVRLAPLRDPADQLIVATALSLGARLVSSDSRIAECKLVPVVA
jgi:PIN domain nuclease of toxin-antitoxin system